MLTLLPRTRLVANPRGLVQSARKKEKERRNIKIERIKSNICKASWRQTTGKKENIKIIKNSFTEIDSICLLVV